MPESAESTARGEGDDARRTRVRVAFLAFVLAQILVPTSYYLGHDRYDERFAWRMFSAVRVEGCTTRAREVVSGSERPIALVRTIHYAWIEHFARNRRAVIDRFLEVRCRNEGTESVTVENACRDARERPLPVVARTRDCRSGAVRTDRLAPEDAAR